MSNNFEEVWSGDGWRQHQRPPLSHEGLVWLSACLRDALGRHRLPDVIVKASAIHLHATTVIGPDGNVYRDGEHWKHRVLLSEHTISVPV